MSRKHKGHQSLNDEETIVAKKTKNEFINSTPLHNALTNTLSIIGDDMMIHILEFLDVKQIIGTCRRVSKQWLDFSNMIPLTITGSEAIKEGSICMKSLPSLTSLKLSNQQRCGLLDCVKEKPTLLLFKNLKSFTFNFSKKLDMSGISYLTSLTCLDLARNSIDSDGFQLIANTKFVDLKSLNLYRNHGKDEGIKCIANSPNMQNLTILDVSVNHASNEGILSIANSENMTNLTWLNVIQSIDSLSTVTIITKAFHSSPFMKNLNSLASNETFLDNCTRNAIAWFVTQNILLFDFVSDELRNDRAFMLGAIAQNGMTLCYASTELNNDKQFVTRAVSNNGYALCYASDELRNDKQVVLAAVSQTGSALRHATNELKNDRQVVLAAVSQNGYALEYASKSLRHDREIISAALETADERDLQSLIDSPSSEESEEDDDDEESD